MKLSDFSRLFSAAIACGALLAAPAFAAITGIDANILGEGFGIDGDDGIINVSIFNDQFVIQAEEFTEGAGPVNGNDGEVVNRSDAVVGANPVIDFSFFNGEANADNDDSTPIFTGGLNVTPGMGDQQNIQVPYVSGVSDRISDLTVIQSDGQNSERLVDIWTMTDPGNGASLFATDNPDLEGSNDVNNPNNNLGPGELGRQQTTIRATDANALIDISGLSSGTLYALFSTNNNGGGTHDAILTATLQDGGSATQTVTAVFNDDSSYVGEADFNFGDTAANSNGGFFNNRYFAAAGINFDDSSGPLDTILVDFFLTGSQGALIAEDGTVTDIISQEVGPQGGGRSRFAGFVLTGVLIGGDPLPGDANGDGSVDLLDLDILGANFGAVGTGTFATGDFNGDTNVDLLDLDILGGNFGAGGTSAAIPEPTTAAMLIASSAALALCRRRS